MTSLNQVQLVGTLGAEPTVASSSTGKQITRISIATNRRVKTTEGEWTEVTDWHKVTLFGNEAEYMAKFGKKGAVVALGGRLQANNWIDKEGVKRYDLDIVRESVHYLGKV